MKNINLIPSSLETKKKVSSRPCFILIASIILLILCVIYFIIMDPCAKKWAFTINARLEPFFKRELTEKPDEPSGHENVFAQNLKYIAGSKRATGHTSNKIVSDHESKKDDVARKPHLQEASVSGITEKNGLKDEPSVNSFIKKIDEQIGNFPPLEDIKSDTAKNEMENGSKGEADEGRGRYFVSICRCVIKENADKSLEELKSKGYSPLLVNDQDNIHMHIVYSDFLENKTEAEAILSSLKANGFEPTMGKSQGDRFSFRIASCFYKKSALEVVRKLKLLGYNSIIVDEITKVKMYSVLLGGFENKEEAQTVKEKLLLSGGYKPNILIR